VDSNQISSVFFNSLAHIPNIDVEQLKRVHQNSHVPVSIRLNPFKPTSLSYPLTNPVPWCDGAYYLPERPVFTADPFFHAGAYYVQEASSMFLDTVIKQTVPLNKAISVLDSCSAPGGKSTLISSLIHQDSVLVANETVKSRAEVLMYNLAKWGRCNHMVTNNDTSVFANVGEMFDVIVCDAPCSGSGLFRKQPEAIMEWGLAQVEQCSLRQKNILDNCIPSLKEGGILIYSTCSYSESENEEVVKYLQEKHQLERVKIKMDASWGIQENQLGYRFYPYALEGEGFFCSVLRKPFAGHHRADKNARPFKAAGKEILKALEDYLDLQSGLEVVEHQSGLKLVTQSLNKIWAHLSKVCYIRQVGTPIGEIKQRSLLPHHFLALSLHLKEGISYLELEPAEAIQYLKKENFKTGAVSKGLKLVKVRHLGLGWAKVLDNRVNNYLPSNLMIFNKEISV
jgi:16S rRNA C967 or C1407 C5-methylase (RsmB/RsmF family)/NOL1/NOP2/fmu family ribosome biogenesis protein